MITWSSSQTGGRWGFSKGFSWPLSSSRVTDKFVPEWSEMVFFFVVLYTVYKCRTISVLSLRERNCPERTVLEKSAGGKPPVV